MPYVSEIGPGTQVYIDNQADQTIITTVSSSVGQQQQSSNRLTTGVWTAPPEIVRAPGGIAVKIFTAQGARTVQVQGNTVTSTAGATESMQSTDQMPSPSSMQPMAPMAPIAPMTMGNLSMTMDPMEMRMGNMEMRMGDPTSSAAANTASASNTAQASTSSTPGTSAKFCTQCGTAVSPEDRFCAQCGHQLRTE
ncbi:MAG: zinc ribbon domain-containing protein [Cyanobacteria bacterium P01_A01_bin.114]